MRFLRRALLLALGALALGASSASAAPYTVGLFGDMPYGPSHRTEYLRVLRDIDRAQVAFSVFDGDMWGPTDGACTNALYARARTWFDSLRRPVVVAPGDNDWTDCWGRYGQDHVFDPLERLAHERRVFFGTGRSLGHTTMPVQRESAEPDYRAYRENARWVRGPVLYVTLDFVGSNDNFAHPGADEGDSRPESVMARMRAEHLARQQANVHWLHEAFALAKRRNLRGVMVIWQADPNFGNEHGLPLEMYDGLIDLTAALRQEVLAFPGRTALVHGDYHTYRQDHPLLDEAGQVVARFTRVETFGDGNDHWVSARIDPGSRGLWTFRPRYVKGNPRR
jgi:hypothetical protein